MQHYRQRDRQREDRLKAVKDHWPNDLSDRTQIVRRPGHQVADPVAMKIFQRLIDQCAIEILPHVELNVAGSIYYRPALQEQEDAAHQVDRKDQQWVVDRFLPSDLSTQFVHRLPDKIWHK